MMAQNWSKSLLVNQRLIDILLTVSVGVELWDLYDEAIRTAKGDGGTTEGTGGAGVSAGANAGAPNPNDDKNKKKKKQTSQNQMQKQVERGQAPKEVERVDEAHNKETGQPHVHFKDKTALNRDGSVHDKLKGTPNITNKIRKWLFKNGWESLKNP